MFSKHTNGTSMIALIAMCADFAGSPGIKIITSIFRAANRISVRFVANAETSSVLIPRVFWKHKGLDFGAKRCFCTFGWWLRRSEGIGPFVESGNCS